LSNVTFRHFTLPGQVVGWFLSPLFATGSTTMPKRPDARSLQAMIDGSGLSLGAIAEAAGLSESGLRKIRRGLVDEVRGTTIARLAKALRVDVVSLRRAIEASRQG